MKSKFKATLELMRPANIITAFADILAGFNAVGGVLYFSSGELEISPDGLGWLLLATFGLYGGGIVFNDLFDASIDAKERPERPIPSGRYSRFEASILGSLLFLIAVVSAFQVNTTALVLATGILIFAFLYDAWAKHSAILGPLFMGICRGGNLLLGGSLLPVALMDIWFIAFIPVLYISAITLISRGEVEGGSRTHGIIAFVLILIVISAVPMLSLFLEFSILTSLPFLLLFAWMVVPAFWIASQTLQAGNIRKAVKRGVVSLVIFNSVLAAGFAGWIPGLIVLFLFPLSLGVAKLFAVT